MIKVEIDSLTFEQVFQGLEGGLRDLNPVWMDVRDILIAFLKKHFQSEGAYPEGGAWKPLSPAYARWKEKHAPGKPILRFRDRLYGSLTEADHEDQIFRRTPDRMEWGTKVPYAIIHQTGSLTVTNRPPKRVVLPAPSKVEGERIADAFLAHMLRKAQGA